MSRPTKYDPAQLVTVEGWARDGLTLEEIAANLQISLATLHGWKKRYPEFAEVLGRGREVADCQVENALFKRATGYTYNEVTYERRRDAATGEERLVEVKRVTKYAPPDVGAQIFWLTNRKPKEWSARREAPVEIPEVPDNGFLEALGAVAAKVWEEGEEEDAMNAAG